LFKDVNALDVRSFLCVIVFLFEAGDTAFSTYRGLQKTYKPKRTVTAAGKLKFCRILFAYKFSNVCSVLLNKFFVAKWTYWFHPALPS